MAKTEGSYATFLGFVSGDHIIKHFFFSFSRQGLYVFQAHNPVAAYQVLELHCVRQHLAIVYLLLGQGAPSFFWAFSQEGPLASPFLGFV